MTLSDDGSIDMGDGMVPNREIVSVSDGISTRNSLEVFDASFNYGANARRVPLINNSDINTRFSKYGWIKSPFVLTRSFHLEESRPSFGFNMDSCDDKNVVKKVRVKFLSLCKCNNLEKLGGFMKLELKKSLHLYKSTPCVLENVSEIIGYFSREDISQNEMDIDECWTSPTERDISCDILFRRCYIDRIR